ncbi:MAG: hypothetical protein ACRDKG_15730 [Actinomycetota bacterium]
MTITPFDEYAVHQTAMPVAHPVGGDRNFYDRYFFNGYSPDGDFFFAVALGVYPNRDVIDGAFSVLHGGVQRAVLASGRLPLDHTVTKIGPLTIEIVEPLRINRVVVDAEHLGIGADITWEGRTMALEEPRQMQISGTTVVQDTTRLTQFGTWEGTIDAGADRIAVTREGSRGMKDRSWGIRRFMDSPGGAPPRSGTPAGVFYLWAPIHFDDRCTHAMLFENADGYRWYTTASEVPLLEPGEPTWGIEEKLRRPRSVDYSLKMRPGTRVTDGSTFTLNFPDGVEQQELEPILDFRLKGIGYLNPKWMHGEWHGEEDVGSDMWEVDKLDPLLPENFHVEQLVSVKSSKGDVGIGVLEQLILGPHAPTGFSDWTSMAPM